MFIFSPLDQFELRDFISIGGSVIDVSFLSFSNFSLYIVASLAIFGIFTNFSNKGNLLIGNRWQVANIAIYDTIEQIVSGQITGNKSGLYFPIIYSLFIAILITNLLSIIPYSFAIIAHLVWVIALSISFWFGVTIIGLTRHGLGFFALFVPSGTPLALVPVLVLIELLSYCARAISLGLRLSANTLSGHLLLAILASLIIGLMSVSIITFVLGFIPVIGLLAIVCLEFAIAMIQAYVFAILACGYLKDALYLH